jgi:formylglycine-generating enzyme required for sulfatase activity
VSDEQEESTATPSQESAALEAERLVKSASGSRVLSRAVIFVGAIAALGTAGWYGYRVYLERGARNVPIVAFPKASTRIGNDLWETESPAHDVAIDAFALDVSEVTVRNFAVCVDRGVCTKPIATGFCTWEKPDTAHHPVTCVTWEQAKAYCGWLSKRLPTEAEWERAARGKEPRKSGNAFEGNYPWGKAEPKNGIANVCGKECTVYGAHQNQNWPAMWEEEDGYPLTAPVGAFRAGATPDGLVDMAGNVWEWTASPYCAYPSTECGNNVEYVIRGGGFLSYAPRNLEVTTREAMNKTDATHTVGFRCAQSM